MSLSSAISEHSPWIRMEMVAWIPAPGPCCAMSDELDVRIQMKTPFVRNCPNAVMWL